MELISTEDRPAVEATGHAGGPDYNLGAEYSRRFTWRLDDGTYYTATHTTFIQGRDPAGDLIGWDDHEAAAAALAVWEAAWLEVRDRALAAEVDSLTATLDAWEAAHPCPIRYTWEEVTEGGTHTTPEPADDEGFDPDMEYGPGSYGFYSTLAAAEEAAAEECARVLPDYFTPPAADQAA